MVTKYYKIRYSDTFREDILISEKALQNNKYYKHNNREFLVLRRLQLKYTCDDLRNLIELMSVYDDGTVQYRLYIKLVNTLRTQIPNLRFTKDERECLWDLYIENVYINEMQKQTLEKVLKIEQ